MPGLGGGGNRELARDGSAAHRPARRANALVPPDDGRGCASIAGVPFPGDDTIRTWHPLGTI